MAARTVEEVANAGWSSKLCVLRLRPAVPALEPGLALGGGFEKCEAAAAASEARLAAADAIDAKSPRECPPAVVSPNDGGNCKRIRCESQIEYFLFMFMKIIFFLTHPENKTGGTHNEQPSDCHRNIHTSFTANAFAHGMSRHMAGGTPSSPSLEFFTY